MNPAALVLSRVKKHPGVRSTASVCDNLAQCLI
jgi:hypothetical protein